MVMDDYWLKVKYRISGLKLLAEIAAIDGEAKERIMSGWFDDNEDKKDSLYKEITQCAKDGICSDKDIQEIVGDMIRIIPEEERVKPDIKGFMFVWNSSGEIFERVYSDEEHKYKLRTIYPGLIPGIDAYGDSFADLAYDRESHGPVHDLEGYVTQGSMIKWGRLISRRSDVDLIALATALSRSGRHLLFAGLEDERLPRIVVKAVLAGRYPDENADTVAENILNEWKKVLA